MELRSEQSFASRVAEFIEHVDYRVAVTDEDRDAVYRLRYDAYLREGAIGVNRQKRFRDRFDELPNVWIFGLYLNNRLASSLRIHIASSEHRESPAMDIFPDILTPHLNAGQTISDPTRFVADADLARAFPFLPYATVRLAGLACDYFGIDLGLATVRAEHQPFYKRLFALDVLSEPRAYPGLKKPIIMMGADCRKVRSTVLAKYPFLTAPAVQLEALFGSASQEPDTIQQADRGGSVRPAIAIPLPADT